MEATQATTVRDHYAYRVAWSPEDEQYVGTVTEFPSLSHLADTQDEALTGIRDLVAVVVADLHASGEPVPEALSDRQYSGKFMVRLAPEQHRRLAQEAAKQGISLNKLAALRLVG
jgi:predicted HicB family RNase H-like nuclease